MLIEKSCTALLFLISRKDNELIEHAYNGQNKLTPQAELSSIVEIQADNLKSYSSCFRVTLISDNRDFRALSWREAFDAFANEIEADYCLLSDEKLNFKPKLAVFDMDSTLIPMEVIDELAAEFGVKDKVSQITEEAMRGELDFNQSFEKRLALLAGMPREAVEKVLERITLNPGVAELTSYLADIGAEIGIASGGFKDFARYVAQHINAHEIKANTLNFNDKDELTGIAELPIVNAEIKAQILTEWAQDRGVKLSETLAVGDGANDWLMLKNAGFGVAYKAKPYLRNRADCVLQYSEMDGLIDILKTVSE